MFEKLTAMQDRLLLHDIQNHQTPALSSKSKALCVPLCAVLRLPVLLLCCFPALSFLFVVAAPSFCCAALSPVLSPFLFCSSAFAVLLLCCAVVFCCCAAVSSARSVSVLRQQNTKEGSGGGILWGLGGILGHFWVDLGVSWGDLGGILGAFWRSLGGILVDLT